METFAKLARTQGRVSRISLMREGVAHAAVTWTSCHMTSGTLWTRCAKCVYLHTCLHTSITYANPMFFHRAENIQIHSYYVPGPTREIHKFTVSHSVADQLCDRLVTTDQLVLYMPWTEFKTGSVHKASASLHCAKFGQQANMMSCDIPWYPTMSHDAQWHHMMPDYIMMSFVIKMHLFRAFSCFTVMVYRHASSVKIHHFHNTHNTVNTYITQHTTKITTHL